MSDLTRYQKIVKDAIYGNEMKSLTLFTFIDSMLFRCQLKERDFTSINQSNVKYY